MISCCLLWDAKRPKFVLENVFANSNPVGLLLNDPLGLSFRVQPQVRHKESIWNSRSCVLFMSLAQTEKNLVQCQLIRQWVRACCLQRGWRYESCTWHKLAQAHTAGLSQMRPWSTVAWIPGLNLLLLISCNSVFSFQNLPNAITPHKCQQDAPL